MSPGIGSASSRTCSAWYRPSMCNRSMHSCCGSRLARRAAQAAPAHERRPEHARPHRILPDSHHRTGVEPARMDALLSVAVAAMVALSGRPPEPARRYALALADVGRPRPDIAAGADARPVARRHRRAHGAHGRVDVALRRPPDADRVGPRRVVDGRTIALLCRWNQNDPGRLTLSVSSHMLPRQLLDR